jgi:flagellar hook-associated protein 1 FlgK
MNGQVPLVLGTTQEQLRVNYAPPPSPTYPGATPNAQILAGPGTDVTELTNGGQLGALLQFRNTTLPSIIGNGSQQGTLNQLAQAFSDRVNQLLENGQTSSGAAGSALYTYDSSAPTSIAATLAENSSLTVSQLAPVDPGPPAVANGIANALASLSSPAASADMINGQSYTDFYGSIAAQIGMQASAAASNQSSQSDLLAQAQNLRAQVSGVSLNDQAATLLQFQQAYEAPAQLINVINTTTQYLMNSIAIA